MRPERSMVDYLPEWQAAKTRREHCMVVWTAAALGDYGVANLFLDAFKGIFGWAAARCCESAMRAS